MHQGVDEVVWEWTTTNRPPLAPDLPDMTLADQPRSFHPFYAHPASTASGERGHDRSTSLPHVQNPVLGPDLSRSGQSQAGAAQMLSLIYSERRLIATPLLGLRSIRTRAEPSSSAQDNSHVHATSSPSVHTYNKSISTTSNAQSPALSPTRLIYAPPSAIAKDSTEPLFCFSFSFPLRDRPHPSKFANASWLPEAA